MPTAPPYQELEEIKIQELIDQVNAADNISVHTGTTIEKVAGAPGMFDVSLTNGGGNPSDRLYCDGGRMEAL